MKNSTTENRVLGLLLLAAGVLALVAMWNSPQR
jgi:hypothetical protein